ncbi:hypothetical protein BU26DRAFT_257636 [Trematosphaeria pertusa]|uniref:Uncharacterized protein n=1 Tax=Trematosphaeria pertusa TaxID=390896 RepID=A0A6A6IQH6_9PLEO|nr:uncharacterized protein BU26DRAFT_257636 [Trematosphaeria pertusa]KAF2252487.1 hypothetical protein BU26DRAFT_257636 [Trematosphaeria pertusa]
MASTKDTFVSSATYNSLPHISDVGDAPEKHADALRALRALLNEHHVPPGISVRLIHKHYDTEDGEVMAFKEVSVPSQGNVLTMGPTFPSSSPPLRGIHFFVDADGVFQAYEYANIDVPDMSAYQTFLDEFGRLILERGLQRIFGLKLDCKQEALGWTEFEFPGKRSTVMIPTGMPVPDEVEYTLNVTTEWGKTDDEAFVKRGCSHCDHTRTCSNHNRPHCGAEAQELSGFYLGGRKIDAASPVFPIMNAVAAVW